MLLLLCLQCIQILREISFRFVRCLRLFRIGITFIITIIIIIFTLSIVTCRSLVLAPNNSFHATVFPDMQACFSLCNKYFVQLTRSTNSKLNCLNLFIYTIAMALISLDARNHNHSTHKRNLHLRLPHLLHHNHRLRHALSQASFPSGYDLRSESTMIPST